MMAVVGGAGLKLDVVRCDVVRYNRTPPLMKKDVHHRHKHGKSVNLNESIYFVQAGFVIFFQNK